MKALVVFDSNLGNTKMIAETIAKELGKDTKAISDKEIGESLNSNINDFEDGVQYFIALNNSINNLITRNISDYKGLDINVLTPKDFLNLEKIKKIIGSK